MGMGRDKEASVEHLPYPEDYPVEEGPGNDDTTETWHAPRGNKTKVAAWVIIFLFLACVVVMIVAILSGPSP